MVIQLDHYLGWLPALMEPQLRLPLLWYSHSQLLLPLCFRIFSSRGLTRASGWRDGRGHNKTNLLGLTACRHASGRGR